MKRASKNNKKTDYFKLKTLTTKDIKNTQGYLY